MPELVTIVATNRRLHASGAFSDEIERITVELHRLMRSRRTAVMVLDRCAGEIPELAALEAKYKEKGFHVVLVCLDQMGSKGVEDFLEQAKGRKLLTLWDRYGVAQKDYKATQLPANVLVGPDGKVLAAWEGYLPERIEELKKSLSATYGK